MTELILYLKRIGDEYGVNDDGVGDDSVGDDGGGDGVGHGDIAETEKSRL